MSNPTSTIPSTRNIMEQECVEYKSLGSLDSRGNQIPRIFSIEMLVKTENLLNHLFLALSQVVGINHQSDRPILPNRWISKLDHSQNADEAVHTRSKVIKCVADGLESERGGCHFGYRNKRRRTGRCPAVTFVMGAALGQGFGGVMVLVCWDHFVEIMDCQAGSLAQVQLFKPIFTIHCQSFTAPRPDIFGLEYPQYALNSELIWPRVNVIGVLFIPKGYLASA
ncbi:hypothetical protein C8R44DRAFT_742086 [Mycena epipterygia]|nr:hypothetical protein C8R44DRAFT_742086 [Mycena epipterygia]